MQAYANLVTRAQRLSAELGQKTGDLWGSKTRIHKIDAGWVASLAPCNPSRTSSWFASSEYDWPKSPT